MDPATRLRERVFQTVVDHYVEMGIVPTPAILRKHGYWSLNGPLSKIRIERMKAAGFTKVNGRWHGNYSKRVHEQSTGA